MQITLPGPDLPLASLWLVTAGLNSRVQHQTEVFWGYLPPSDRS